MTKATGRKKDVWTLISWIVLGIFILFFIYPLVNLLRQAFFDANGFTMKNFAEFFSRPYYTNTIKNSFKVSIPSTTLREES